MTRTLMEIVAQTQFLNPEAVIKEAGIKHGDTVADFGCASGYFTLPCAQCVGPSGHVFALDVLPHALTQVENKARKAGRHNIETRRVNLEAAGGSKIEDQCIDWVVMKNVLFMSTNRAGMMAEAARIVCPVGKVLVVDWREDEHRGIGPVAQNRISQSEVSALADAAGLELEKEITAGDYHYGMIFRKKTQTQNTEEV